MDRLLVVRDPTNSLTRVSPDLAPRRRIELAKGLVATSFVAMLYACLLFSFPFFLFLYAFSTNNEGPTMQRNCIFSFLLFALRFIP